MGGRHRKLRAHVSPHESIWLAFEVVLCTFKHLYTMLLSSVGNHFGMETSALDEQWVTIRTGCSARFPGGKQVMAAFSLVSPSAFLSLPSPFILLPVWGRKKAEARSWSWKMLETLSRTEQQERRPHSQPQTGRPGHGPWSLTSPCCGVPRSQLFQHTMGGHSICPVSFYKRLHAHARVLQAVKCSENLRWLCFHRFAW